MREAESYTDQQIGIYNEVGNSAGSLGSSRCATSLIVGSRLALQSVYQARFPSRWVG